MKNIVLSYVLKFEHATELHVTQFNTKKEATDLLDNHKLNKWILLWKIREVYGKISGKYIEMTETVEDLETKIKKLEAKKISKDSFDLIEKLIANHRKEGMKLLSQCEEDSQDEADLWEEIKDIDKAINEVLSCV